MNRRQFGDLLRPWQTRTHCCRQKCFPICLRAQHLLWTQILCPGHKKCFWFCSETFCVHNKCYPVCAAQETSWKTMCPRLPGPLRIRYTGPPSLLMNYCKLSLSRTLFTSPPPPTPPVIDPCPWIYCMPRYIYKSPSSFPCFEFVLLWYEPYRL